MSTHEMATSYAPQKRLSLFDSIQKLPIELVDLVIRFGLFSDPLGSHAALHTFQACSREQLSSPMKNKIDSIFGGLALQKKIQKEWQLHPNFDNAKRYQYTPGETSEADLASWSVSHCFPCCSFLLQHGAVPASTYCKTGESLFALAADCDNLKFMELIVSKMNDQHLFEPCDLRTQDRFRHSMFEASTSRKTWFMTVWRRARLLPRIDPSSLKTIYVAAIARFADAELAQELHERGIDLGRSYEGHIFPSVWSGIFSQKDPVSVLAWLRKVGHRPPKGYLVAATKSRKIPVLGWILEQSENYDDWRAAISIAAERAPMAVIFELLLRKTPTGRRNDDTLFNDISVEIVNAACKGLQSPPPIWQSTTLGGLNSSEPLEYQLEKDAVLKIKALGKLARYANIVSLKVKSSDAGLHKLTNALELLDSELEIAVEC